MLGMLLWQWKNVHKKAVIWGHLVSITLMLHILGGYIFFSWLRHGIQHVRLTMQRDVSKIPVVFGRPHLAQSTVPTPVLPAQSMVKKGTASSLKTSIAQPNSVKKKGEKKIVQKKTSTKKKPVKKEIKKTPPKKEVLQKKELSVKKEEPKKIEKKDVPVIEKVIETPIVVTPVTAQSVVESVMQPAQEETVSGVNKEEAELYALVAQQWAPPVGIAASHECEVSAEIGWNQEIIKAWVSKKSGILMYDLAARKAVMQTKFPLWTRGKTVTIRFVQ